MGRLYISDQQIMTPNDVIIARHTIKPICPLSAYDQILARTACNGVRRAAFGRKGKLGRQDIGRIGAKIGRRINVARNLGMIAKEDIVARRGRNHIRGSHPRRLL